ncbi:MOSC domain-containing protein [Actinophytocola gossypii]|uniref:MOSC domain-containing protein n=1 Tax=Actinophytocola gossypii TaxID=2812003 RepID=A0ABT2JDM6_9PSEU|nr:MOSC N-terminal beta barrel domain-containing protein [Actinophytocola gossypii]MCT2585988.1 MOSC domain-containing protein [Actinophytocola gossypii]
MPTVAALTYYPIKGCAGVSVSSMDVTPAGPVHDRTFMVVSAEDGLFRSQRRTPALAVVRPALETDGSKLTLSASGREDLVVDVLLDGPRRTVDVHGVWQGDGVDQGTDAAAWLSDLVGERVRLVRVPPDHDRMLDERHGPVTFTDSTALHLIAQASLDDLNARILEAGAEPVPMARFRPNVVVTGVAAYGEDDVRAIEAGALRMRWVKPDVRCKVTMVDQETGERAGPEPLRTLATYRREPEGGVSFGIKLRVASPGPIAVGDELSWSADR